VVSNELFDALPAQPWRWTGEVWEREVLTQEGPAWQAADPGQAGTWFGARAEGGLEPGDGSVWVEGLPGLVQELAGSLEAGLFLAIDYGDSAARLLAKGADLRRFKGHSVDGAWWEALGEGDLTADVDFTRLASLLQGEGFSGTQAGPTLGVGSAQDRDIATEGGRRSSVSGQTLGAGFARAQGGGIATEGSRRSPLSSGRSWTGPPGGPAWRT
jgi:hypothetical protein